MTRAVATRALLEAVLIAMVATVAALAFNALRPAGLPLIAQAPYEVLVPCPEPGGPVAAIEPSDAATQDGRTFIIDARSKGEFELGHFEGAVNVPYDWLDPVPEAELKRLAASIAASGATRVVVYGDGARPDSGEHLGREISGRGIRNVTFVRGGAPALLGRSEP